MKCLVILGIHEILNPFIFEKLYAVISILNSQKITYVKLNLQQRILKNRYFFKNENLNSCIFEKLTVL